MKTTFTWKTERRFSLGSCGFADRLRAGHGLGFAGQEEVSRDQPPRRPQRGGARRGLKFGTGWDWSGTYCAIALLGAPARCGGPVFAALILAGWRSVTLVGLRWRQQCAGSAQIALARPEWPAGAAGAGCHRIESPLRPPSRELYKVRSGGVLLRLGRGRSGMAPDRLLRQSRTPPWI